MHPSAVVLLACAVGTALSASDDEAEWHGSGAEIDAEAGCTEDQNVLVALLLGLMGGAFACILPCCTLCMRAQKKWAENFLDASNTNVRRIDAEIVDKKVHQGGGESNSTSYTVVLKFEVKRDEGTRIPVRAQCGVSSDFWSRVDVGSQVETAYEVGNEKEFAIVEELQTAATSSMGKRRVMCCFLTCFSLVGLLIGGASGPLTGCFFGLVPFFALILAGSIAGYYVLFRLMRMLAQSQFYVSTSEAPPPSEKMIIGVSA